MRRAARFGLSGLLVTILHAAIAAALIELIILRPAIANGIAFAAATLTSYILNTFWSFSHKPAPGNLLRFLAVSALGLVIAMTIAGLADLYGLPYWGGIACVVAAVPPITFLLHNFWTYR